VEGYFLNSHYQKHEEHERTGAAAEAEGTLLNSFLIEEI